MRIAIVDSSRMGSQLLTAALQRDGCEIVYAGTKAEDAIQAVRQNRAEVALLSTTLEGVPDRGYDLAAQLCSCPFKPGIVLLLDSCTRESVVRAFRSGARGVFGRDDSMDALGKCVARVREGQIWASNDALRFVLEALVAPPRIKLHKANGGALLAPREEEVVHWVSEGFTNREIADRLGLSENTVKNYLFRIFDKLGISKRVELILYAASQLESSSRTKESAPLDSIDPAAALGDERLLFRWCREAVQRFSLNEAVLAEMYRDGRGVAQDKTEALAWFLVAEVAAAKSAVQARLSRQEIQKQLGAADLARAKSLAEGRIRTENPERQKAANDLKLELAKPAA